MATLVRGYTFGATEQVTASKLHGLVDNGGITLIVNDDISSSAAIADTKLGTIATAGKVAGTALSGLNNIDSSAGVIPAANLPTVTAFQFPVGFVVTLGVSTNPNTLFGYGTWTAITGRVIVGIDAGQTEFDTLNETGGAKTHTLTETEMPAHTHTTAPAGGSSGNNYLQTAANVSVGLTTVTSSTGGSGAHNNLQPYIVKYVWERTA